MSKFLHLYVQNASEFNIELVNDVRACRASLMQVLSFCDNCRVIGIGTLFLSGTSGELRRRLHQSGRAYAYFLEKADPSVKRGSKVMPYFDAISSGDLKAAALIAQHSARTWAQGEEYEEDFLFPEYLMQRYFLDALASECVALLDRWEKALMNTVDARLDACRALQAKDSEAFDAALRSFLLDRSAYFERQHRKDRLAPELWDTEAKFSVEGLALLKLAEKEGLSTEVEYPMVPSIARDSAPMTFHPDDWWIID